MYTILYYILIFTYYLCYLLILIIYNVLEVISMETLTLFLIALGLAMDAFAVSVSNGLCFNNFKKSQALLSSLTFGLFQGLMPTIGFFAGTLFFDTISKLDHWIALFLLSYIGLNMIIDSIKELKCKNITKKAEQKNYNIKTLFLQAIATSIDALAVGISFAALKINILTAALFICIITFFCCLIGALIGKKFGHLLQEKAKIFGGIILIFIGLKIFIEHTLGI